MRSAALSCESHLRADHSIDLSTQHVSWTISETVSGKRSCTKLWPVTIVTRHRSFNSWSASTPISDIAIGGHVAGTDVLAGNPGGGSDNWQETKGGIVCRCFGRVEFHLCGGHLDRESDRLDWLACSHL